MAESIEAAGFDGAWVGDSLLASPRPDAITTLAAVAARTKRINLGTSILIAALRHPVSQAYSLATLDLISKGRLILGLGFASSSPTHKLESSSIGVPNEQRFAHAAEGIEIMRALWSQDDVTYHGKHYAREGVTLLPKPVQRPGPELWVHGKGSDVALRRVARLGDGWMANMISADQFAVDWQKIRGFARDGGRDAQALTACAYCTVSLDDDAAKAQERGRAFLASYYRADPLDLEKIMFCRYGTPESCVEELLQFVDAGASTLVIRFAGDNQMEQLELCAARLLPALKAASAPA